MKRFKISLERIRLYLPKALSVFTVWLGTDEKYGMDIIRVAQEEEEDSYSLLSVLLDGSYRTVFGEYELSIDVLFIQIIHNKTVRIKTNGTA